MSLDQLIVLNDHLRKRNNLLENQNHGLIGELDQMGYLEVPKPVFPKEKKPKSKKRIQHSSSERQMNVQGPNSDGRKSQ